MIGPRQVFQKVLSGFPRSWRHLGQPDDGFRCLHLAEEGANVAELVMPPMLEKARRLRRHLPVAGIWQHPPPVHMPPHLVDILGGRIILLLLGRKPLAFVEDDGLLALWALPFLRLWDRCNELRPAAALNNPLCRLSACIEFPVSSRILIGRVQDGVLKEWVGHLNLLLCQHGHASRRHVGMISHCKPTLARLGLPTCVSHAVFTDRAS